MSSSGLTPAVSSARADQLTPSSESTPLPVETRPEPLIRSPSQVARAVFSVATIPLLFAGTGRPIVLLAFQRVGQVVDVEAARVGVRVDVALAAAELLRAVVVRVAQLVGRSDMAVLADVLRRFAERGDDGVRLRRASKVDGRLREIEPRLGKADVLDGVGRRDRDEERARIGVPDVLRGEDDHPPGDEARVL